jgi:hypothetical protein
MSEEAPDTPSPPDPLASRRRVEFQPMPLPFTGGRGKTMMFLIILAVCAGASAFMFFVQHMPLSDMRVIAPAIGALWFGLRLFMTLTPRS